MVDGTAGARILLVEDSEDDAELITRELRVHLPAAAVERVDTAAALSAALAAHPWDAVISDWEVPGFGGLAALAMVRGRNLDVPFVIVSGVIGDEPAVNAMRAGAHDFVPKDKLARLGAAVTRELHVYRERRAFTERRAEDDRFFSLSANLLCVAGFDGYLKRVNSAWQRLLGWSEAELTATPWIDFIHPGDREAVRAVTARLVGSSEEVVSFESRQLAKDGRDRTLLWSAVPVHAEQRIYAVAHDVTAQRALQAQLRQAQKLEAIGLLAGGIAHDFNNLLTVVLAYSAQMLDELAREDPYRTDVQEIHGAGMRAAELTRQLLAFSRRQLLEPRVLDLNDQLQRLARMLKRLLREDIVLTIRADPGLGQIFADPGQLDQVLINLAVNARDAMPGGGRLTIETASVDLTVEQARQHPNASAGPHVMVSVIDTGVGMDEPTRERIFEPFFTTKELGHGTGLGLSTVLGVVTQSGGHVNVRSEPGRGTTFELLFPLHTPGERAPAPDEATAAAAETATSGGNETILLVEDDEAVRTLVRELLRRQGYNVLEAQNAGEAFLIAEQHTAPIHLLLSDVIMPRMHGTVLAERLRRVRPHLRILFMSGYAEGRARQGLSSPDVAFLPKPILPEALRRAVRLALDRPR